RPRGRRAGVSGHDPADRIRRGTGLRLGERLRASLLSPDPDSGADRLGGVHRGPRPPDHDRRARPDRPAEQPGARGRGDRDARYPRPGPPGGRVATRNDERVPELRPEPERVAGATRRGDGTHPQSVDGTAAVRLAGPPLPVSNRVDLAATPATAP